MLRDQWSSGLSFHAAGGEHLDQLRCKLTIRLGDPDEPSGALVITNRVKREPDSATLRLCAEVAASYDGRIASNELGADAERVLSPSPAAKGIEWKARALGILQRRVMA